MSKILSILAPARRLCAGGGPGSMRSRCRENLDREFWQADLLRSINYFWALPRIPPGTPTLRATLPSRSASVKLRYLGYLRKCTGCPIPVSSVQFSSVSSVSSVSWFGEASRGEPGYPDFHEFLKVKKADDWTCPFAPIKRSLHRSDAADCEVATLTPLIGWFSAPAGTFEFGHFQETHE